MKKVEEMNREEIREELEKYEEEDREYERVNYVRRKDYERRMMLDEKKDEVSKIRRLNELIVDMKYKKESNSWREMNEVRDKRREEILIEKILKMYIRGEISEEEIEKLGK